MTTEEAREKIQNDPDFVYLKRYDFSLIRLLNRYPDGCPDHVIASALMITEEDVVKSWEAIVQKIRANMKVDL